MIVMLTLHSDYCIPGVMGLGIPWFAKKIHCGMQILHDRGNHWIVASSIGCEDGTVKVYDSLYTHVSERTKDVIRNLFHLATIKNADLQKQEGGKDCGLFSIAVVTLLLFGKDPSSVHFCQPSMRNHLLKCFTTVHMSLFPEL
jgi:hypothetical protein